MLSLKWVHIIHENRSYKMSSEQLVTSHPTLHPCSNAVKPLPDSVVYQPYEVVAKTIQTGDLLLFSSLKTTSSLIKLFDHAMFGHTGIVSTPPQLCSFSTKPLAVKNQCHAWYSRISMGRLCSAPLQM